MTVTDRAEGQPARDIHTANALGSTSCPGQLGPDNQSACAGASSPQATAQSAPNGRAPADLLADDQASSDTHSGGVVGDPTAPGHHDVETHRGDAGGNHSEPPVGQACSETQVGAADGWLELRIWCEQLEDAMQARIAATNRAERGGVDPVIYEHYITALTAAEHVCELAMKRCYRRVVPPEIVAWQKSEKGLGEKLIARLLGHLGDPCIATPHHWEGTGSKRVLVGDEPYARTVSQLWQYCGVGNPHLRKHKGMTPDEAFALGSPAIKMLMRLNAEACMKTSGYYREVYDKARAAYDGKTHGADCVRCGPSGKPALVGSPWSPGHQHAAALRKVAKEILRDLWRVRRAALICPPTITVATPTSGSLADTLDLPTNALATPRRPPSAGELEQGVA